MNDLVVCPQCQRRTATVREERWHVDGPDPKHKLRWLNRRYDPVPMVSYTTTCWTACGHVLTQSRSLERETT